MKHNMPASVHRRLLNLARADELPFNDLLQRFVLERFLYRLGRSVYRDRFVLKGAIMLNAWQVRSARPTRDIDLLGRMDNHVEAVESAVWQICQESVPDDGLRFDGEGIIGKPIIIAANYEGVRLRFHAYLGKARIPIQIDVGFGDPIVPGPGYVRLPALLGFPAPELQGYSRESVIAEKYHAMVQRGLLNSRMKDYYDVWALAGQFAFDGPVLAKAIRVTFDWRSTLLESDPVALTGTFAANPQKKLQWAAFLRRLGDTEVPSTLSEIVKAVAQLLGPVGTAISGGLEFSDTWAPGGPWEPRTRERP